MQTLLAYSGSFATATTDNDLTAIADPSMSQQNSHFVLPKTMQLMAAYVMGVGVHSPKIQSPSLRRIAVPSIYPSVRASAVPTDPNIADYRANPLNIPALEEIQVLASNDDAGTQRCWAGLFLADGAQPVQGGSDIFTVRCTAAITCVANTWVSGNLTFGQSLPVGTYAIVGMFAQSATGIFARLIFPGGTIYRPGVMCVTAIGNRQPFAGRKAPMGVLGTFQSTALPQLDVLASSTDSAQVVYLDLVKIG